MVEEEQLTHLSLFSGRLEIGRARFARRHSADPVPYQVRTENRIETFHIIVIIQVQQ